MTKAFWSHRLCFLTEVYVIPGGWNSVIKQIAHSLHVSFSKVVMAWGSKESYKLYQCLQLTYKVYRA